MLDFRSTATARKNTAGFYGFIFLSPFVSGCATRSPDRPGLGLCDQCPDGWLLGKSDEVRQPSPQDLLHRPFHYLTETLVAKKDVTPQVHGQSPPFFF